jgi:hypothetical protein
MNWWDSLAGNKQYPSVPEREVEGDFRFPASMLCGVLGFVLLAAAVVAAFIGANTVGGWALGLAVASIVLAQLLLPSDKRRK